MGELRGNVNFSISMKCTASGKGNQTWTMDASHVRPLLPGSGAGKVSQGCAKVLMLPDEYVTVNLKTLASGAADTDKAVPAGDIARIATVMIKNLSKTATVLVVKPGTLGFDGLTAKLPPGSSVAIDYNEGIDMGVYVNIQLLSNQNDTPVEIYAAGC